MNPTMGYQRPESGIPVMLTILFAITILSRGSNALDLSTQQCSALTEADDLVIEPAAEAFITTLLGVNAPNAGGEGCGDPSEGTVIVVLLEAFLSLCQLDLYYYIHLVFLSLATAFMNTSGKSLTICDVCCMGVRGGGRYRGSVMRLCVCVS